MTNRLDSERETYHASTRYFYPTHFQGNFNNNLGLLKLDRKVKFSDRVRPACLSEKTFTGNENLECTFSGFGATAGNGKRKL